MPSKDSEWIEAEIRDHPPGCIIVCVDSIWPMQDPVERARYRLNGDGKLIQMEIMPEHGIWWTTFANLNP